jgi:PAS domain S-box-containing protein
MKSQGTNGEPVPQSEDDSAAEVAQAYLAAIVESTEDAIIGKDLNGIIQSWNSAAERMFGYTATEAIGQPIMMLLPEDRKGEEEMISARIRRGEKVQHFDTQRLAKDGRLLDVSVTTSPIKNKQGHVIGASKVVRDMKDRMAAEADRLRLTAIVEASDDAIISKDLNGTVLTWNGGAERIFGYMAEEMIGQPITKILPPDRLDEEERILSRLAKGTRVDHFETLRRHKDGSLVEVSVTISPIRDAFGRIVGASKVARDITDRKVLEATMIHLREELEERVTERTSALEAANKEMESFTHSIAHDLRGPIRAIASTSSVLKEDYADQLPEEARDLLQRQIAASKRLGQLIEDLLRYSRLGRSALTPEPLDLTQIAKEVSAELSESRHDCSFKIQEDLNLTGDRSLVRLLMQNLMDNACKFTEGPATVEVGREGQTFFVRDHGRGFDMAHADKIFLPFERLVSHDEVPGSGIGLANVRRIIDRHGGAIWVSSVAGQGTTFYFTFPARPPEGSSKG